MSEDKKIAATELKSKINQLKVKAEEIKQQECIAKVQLPPLMNERKMFRQKFFELRQKKTEEGISEDEEAKMVQYRSISVRVMKTIRRFEIQIAAAEDLLPKLVDDLKLKSESLALLEQEILTDIVNGGPAPAALLSE